jgi:nucleoside-diphosphate-sugar epimerase
VFDNLSANSKHDLPKNANLINADLRDRDKLFDAVKGHDAVINLAAKALVPESIKDPQLYFDVNLSGGQNVLEAMRQAGIKKIVHSSTCAVYGTPKKVPIVEDDPKFPISPYGATKYAFEQLLHAYHKSYGIDVTMFRYFNPYGPNEFHEPETHAIPNFIKATLTDQPIPLYWKGEQERDFFYVEDLAEAHVLGLQDIGFNYFNIGSGHPTKVIDLVHMIFELAGKKTPISDLGERAGDPPKLFASIDKVRYSLGWQPKTSLQNGLERTIADFKQHPRPIDH